ncbi:MAG: crossover junction endodeoxyribonuclease RuvC [Pseudomonadota bacterium]|jgi:crossover junction endodeoxyribonuclease RuvC
MLVGIDPGASGAVAWLSDNGHLIEARDLPVTKVGSRTQLMPAVLAGWLMQLDRRPIHAFLERVATRPGEGAVGAFSFGRGYGQIEGVLAALGIPVTLVTPQSWKRSLGVPADKSAARARAAQLWPGLAGTFARVKDDGRAEASLIGLYGAHSLQGHGSAAA